MASKAVVDAVEARLVGNWDACLILGTNLEGEVPKDGSEFLQVQYPVANSEQASIGAPGANVWREEGAFLIRINVKRGRGRGPGLQWAEQLSGLFRGQIFGGMECFAPSPPVEDDRNDVGKYWVYSIAVPYRFDLIG